MHLISEKESYKLLQHFLKIQNSRSFALIYALTSRLGVAAIAAAGFASPVYAASFTFVPGDLIVSGSTYSGTASTVTVGQTLPGGGTAVANGTYPGVFSNEGPDPSFGVTAPIFLQEITTSGTNVGTANIDPSVITNSFPSKSELALNLTADGTGLTFMGYATGINQLDVSNSNTPGITEPGNPVTTTSTYREVAQINYNAQVNASGYITPQVTTTNAYPGNNARTAILGSNGLYYTVGNAGNGSGSTAVTAATGVQIVTPGVNATSATPGTTQVGLYSIAQNGYTADKIAKDNNFRGETIFNNTLYVTKGSGSNGINSVYQVGTTGTLPTGTNNTISILPGFPTALANGTASAINHPFGLFFANANTLYVADEGDGVAADAASSTTAGLQKWSLVNGSWTEDYVLQNGLNLGTQYTVAGLPTNYNPATDGLRNITGKVNGDGTVSLYGVTSTVSASTDEGADSNEVVAITDTLSNTTAAQAASEQFSTIDAPVYAQVFRGVSFAPAAVPEPSSILGSLGALGFGVFLVRRQLRARKIASL